MDKKEHAKFINEDFIYAIVGATQNKEKYGYKVLVDLKDKGYKVIPINPNYEEVAGEPCYPDLISLNERPDVVVLVVGEKNAEKVVQDCVDLDLNRIWFQPGSEYDKAVQLAEKSGFNTVIGECIMIQTSKIKI
ncbi:CoA-binding protein [Patescibacteria group bacterium]